MDKLHHFVYGYAIALTACFLIGVVGGVSVGIVAGLVKDVGLDKWLKMGRFEVYDILATVAGSACAAIIFKYA